MKKNRLIGIVVLLTLNLVALFVNAQPFDFSPDRPGVSSGSSVLFKGIFQFETGTYYQTDKATSTETWSLNTTLVRYGVVEHVELRIGSDLIRCRINNEVLTGFIPFTLGTKIALFNGQNAIPKTSLLVNFTLPHAGKKEFSAPNIAPSLYLLMNNDLTKNWSLGYNLGLEFDGATPVPAEFAAICLSYHVTPALSTYFENYNYFSAGSKAQSFVDFGAAFLLNEKMQFDISFDTDPVRLSSIYSVNAGFSVQF